MKEFRPVILMPTYNTGSILPKVVRGVLRTNYPIWLAVDGSTDGSHEQVMAECGSHPQFRMLEWGRNEGKGAVLLKAARVAVKERFTHLLTMDADGQHPATSIQPLLEAAESQPDGLIMGKPVFGGDAPPARLLGRNLTIWWTDFETACCGLGDTLFGMRVYPLQAFLEAFAQTSHARGFDFDPEIAVRLAWLGIKPVQVEVPVRYIPEAEGGVSHFHYVRDNIKLTWLHFRLVPEYLFYRYWIIRKKRSLEESTA